MLRSRSNRTQRPSEPSDERSGSSAYYGGYPSSPSPIGLSDGSGGEYGHSNNWGYEKKTSRGASSSSNAALNPFKEKSRGSCFSGSTAWYCFLTIVFIALSIDVFYHYRAYNSVNKHLAVVQSHIDTFEPDEDGDESTENVDNSSFESQPQQAARENTIKLQSLHQSTSQLKESLSHISNAQIPRVNSDISAVRAQVAATTRENTSYNIQLETLRTQRTAKSSELTQLKTEYINKHKNDEGKFLIPGRGGMAKVEAEGETLSELERYVKDREDTLWKKLDGLMSGVKRSSYNEVMEWFGPGPHKVELEIEYPRPNEDQEPSEWPRVRGVFLIELAPLNLMPVAVNVFLQQVHHKLWNGCAFVINAVHILQAGPHRYTNDQYVPNQRELMNKFIEAKLDKMPFQEYHEEYPHEMWTVGFSGRPGGPDFYINKMNNVRNHGPGGQKTHDLHEEADPCFGKVIKGTELLNDINKLPIDYHQGYLLKQHIEIVDARIVTEERNPLEEHEHDYEVPDFAMDDDYHKDHLAEREEQQQAENAGQNGGAEEHVEEVGRREEVVQQDETQQDVQARGAPGPSPLQ